MDFKLIIIALIMMLPILLTRFIPALKSYTICLILPFLVGMCVLCAGVAKFTNIENFTNIKEEKET